VINESISCDHEFNITQTHETLDVIEKQLKIEFVGIDEQIEQLINGIKPWLFFRQSLHKPVVINLVGMTGTGKTALIERLLDLMNLKFHAHRINGSELNSDNPLNALLFEHSRSNDHPIVIFDEFQHYRAKNENGFELEDYNSTLWDFIDTGILKEKRNFGENAFNPIVSAVTILDALLYFGIEKRFKNLTFKINKDQYKRIEDLCEYSDESVDDNRTKFVIINEKVKEVGLSESLKTMLVTCCIPKDDFTFVFSNDFLTKIGKTLELYDIYLEKDYIKELEKMSFNEFFEVLSVILNDLINSERKPTLDLSKSLIFVIANVDECFEISSNQNPDISSDEFYKITKKISLVDVKEALLKRFRPEHLARLGNTFIIYPSIRSNSYRKIISNLLNDYSKHIKKTYNIILEYDKSINSMLYKETVFPTQGVRPLQNGVCDIIKSNFANTLLYKDMNNIQCDKILYSYNNKCIRVSFYYENNIVGTTKHKITLRVDNLRENKKNEYQALVAVHETGHALVNIVLKEELPISIYSVTADTSSGGFTWNPINDDKITNEKNLREDVMVCLGGLAAENVVFGEGLISNGASSDLRNANAYLFNAYRNWGMGKSLLIRSVDATDDDIAQEYENDYIQKDVEQELNRCMVLTIELLKEEKVLLYHLSKYLSEHSTISRVKLVNFIRRYAKTINVNNIRNDKKDVLYGYKEKLKEFGHHA
jgi:cell division protease FtsH